MKALNLSIKEEKKLLKKKEKLLNKIAVLNTKIKKCNKEITEYVNMKAIDNTDYKMQMSIIKFTYTLREYYMSKIDNYINKLEICNYYIRLNNATYEEA